MSARAVLVWLLAAALAVLLDAVVPGGGTRAPAALPEGRLLLPGLQARLPQVGGIRLDAPGAPPLVLARRGGLWHIQSPPMAADGALVQSWLRRLARARIVQAKTRDAARYAELDVAAPGARGAGILLWLTGVPGIPALLIGRYDAREDGTFVRLSGRPQALLAGGDLTPPRRAVDWMHHPLLALPAGAVLQVDLLGPGGARFLVDRGLDGALHVPMRPRGLAQPLATGRLLLDLFEGFDYDGVHAPEPAPAQALRLRALLSDGSLLTLHVWRSAQGQALGNLTIQAPAGGLPADAAAGLARTAERVQAHTWRLMPGVWSLLHGALYPGAGSSSAPGSRGARP